MAGVGVHIRFRFPAVLRVRLQEAEVVGEPLGTTRPVASDGEGGEHTGKGTQAVERVQVGSSLERAVFITPRAEQSHLEW